MRTLELMIVFGALMAIVAVVAIAIDWVGKPLRGRRFIPRVYRFDDELEPAIARRPAMAMAPMAVPVAAAPLPPMPPMPAVPTAAPTSLPHAPAAFSSSVAAPNAKVDSFGAADQTWAPNPTVVSVPAVELHQPTNPQPIDTDGADDWDQLLQSDPDSAISGVDPAATQDWTEPAESWDVSMPLDAVVGGRRPTPIDKAERFWKSVGTAAANSAESHFDKEHVERMLAGRAPNRLNPRTGRHESPELLGLRAASHPAQVQVFWPGEATDPWSAQ